jgi:glucan 1,3-beta-glucosidase
VATSYTKEDSQTDTLISFSNSALHTAPHVTGLTDDTAALQSCLDAAGAVAGKVLLPAGVYLITSSLSVPAGVTLVGVG